MLALESFRISYHTSFYPQFPSVLLFAVAMFFASATLPHEYNTENMLYLLFWGAMVGVTAKGIFRYGNEFVDFPKLLPLNDKKNA